MKHTHTQIENYKERDKYKIIVGGFNPSLLVTHRKYRQKSMRLQGVDNYPQAKVRGLRRNKPC